MSAPIPMIVPDEAEVFAIAKLACAAHLKLVTNGSQTRLAPYVPPGWRLIAVSEKVPAA